MSSISSLLSNGYFSLKGEKDKAEDATASTPSLANALANLNTPSGTATHADSVDLSPEARAYLASLSGNTDYAYSSTDHYTLTSYQKETIDAVLARYKDAPFTEETFQQIQEDLDNAGLSTEVLKAQDDMRSFNPTQSLLDALNGTNSDDMGMMTPFINSDASTTKANNFLKSVASQWADISTTIEDTEL